MRTAIWFGLIAGLVEAFVTTVSSAVGHPTRVGPQVFWAAPLVNIGLLLLAGAVLITLARVRLLTRLMAGLVVIFPWFVFFLVLQLIGHIALWAQLLLSLGLAVSLWRMPLWSRLPTLIRRTLLPLLILTAAGAVAALVWAPVREWAAGRTIADAPGGPPNVILITLDTVRADHVSAYGYSRPTTPNLDGLAATGVLFAQAFSNSSWTLPAHGSLLTGRYPHEHGADWRQPMEPGTATLAEFLANKGYRTAAFAANTSYVAPEWGLGRGFGRFEVYGGSWTDDVVRTMYGRRLAMNLLPPLGYFDVPGRKRAGLLNAEFFSWLDVGRSKPFFAFLNYFDAHDPYLTVAPFQTRYAADPARGDVINFQFQANAFRRKPVVTPREIQAEVDAYDGCLTYLDSELGLLFAELRRRQIDRDTIVIVTSDHGESFGAHDLFGHGNSLYLETIRVPLVIVWPGHVPAGVRVSQPVGLERVSATIASLLGAGDRTFPGRSLATGWQSPPDVFDPVLSEVTMTPQGPSGYPTSHGTLTSLVTREWHLIVSTAGTVELYAWPIDPAEAQNLATGPEGRNIPELRATMDRLRAQGGSR
jgi:arylsulfatase A-like enzyme